MRSAHRPPGAEPLLYSLLGRLEWDLAMSTSSLQCLKLDPGLRKRIADTLVPTSKIKVRSSIQRASPRLTSGAQDILYVVLVAQGRVITLVRPKKHSIHPSDLHILVNTVHSPSIINSAAAASWLPICLPKFNASAFVNAYVSFLRRAGDDAVPTPIPRAADGAGSPPAAAATPDDARSESTVERGKDAPLEVGLICVSGLADFEAVRDWCATASEVRCPCCLRRALC